jgi:acetyl esterase/lipase
MRKGLFSTFLACTVFAHMNASAQTVVPLYSGTIPNSKASSEKEMDVTTDGILRISHITQPTLTIFTPKLDNGPKSGRSAVIVCPGGGYWIVAAGHEGSEVAQRLADSGFVALVLKYRLPDDSIMVDKSIGPLQDAQRAIQYVRENANRLGVDPHRIGIMGFSAGGHLASTAGTHFDHAYIANPKHISLRPDFMVLGYPVISFTDSIGHTGSRDNLLGKNPPGDSIVKYSNELQVTARTPPTFLVHAKDDATVKVANTLDFAAALRAHGVPVGVYLFEQGGHGFGLHNPSSSVDWLAIAVQWLHAHGF